MKNLILALATLASSALIAGELDCTRPLGFSPKLYSCKAEYGSLENSSYKIIASVDPATDLTTYEVTAYADGARTMHGKFTVTDQTESWSDPTENKKYFRRTDCQFLDGAAISSFVIDSTEIYESSDELLKDRWIFRMDDADLVVEHYYLDDSNRPAFMRAARCSAKTD